MKILLFLHFVKDFEFFLEIWPHLSYLFFTVAIKKVIRTPDPDQVVFVTYHPSLPSISKIVQKHYRTMIQSDPSMKETFPSPPIIAYKRPPTIKDKLIYSKVPETRIHRPKRQLNGMKKCRKCVNCPCEISCN